jgi:hypothetical protein
MRLYFCAPNFYVSYTTATRTIALNSRSTTGGENEYTWGFPYVFTSNQWFHIAILFDRRAAAAGSKQVIYVNGTRYLSGPLGPAFSGATDFATPFVIGNNGAGGGIRNFDGVLDEMRVYNRFITDEEARMLATDPDNNHAPVIEGPTNLIAKVAQPVALQGVAMDDGQPFGKTLATRWSVVSGDASKVQFADASVPGTDVTFTKTGDYVILISASDGEQQAAALVRVTVVPTGTLLCVQ